MYFWKRSIVRFLLAIPLLFSGQALAGDNNYTQSVQEARAQRLNQLLIQPDCLKLFDRRVQSFRIIDVTIPSGDIELSGQLFLPPDTGIYPAVVFMHGGGNDAELLMAGPRFYARRLAHCGVAALIYYERGTGKSGGVFHEATFDDYINDAGAGVKFLCGRDDIDTTRIGVYGGSEGGRLAPVVAVRFPEISFAISSSGPIGSLADQANFNINYALRLRGFPDSVVDAVMPLWRRHHASWESNDPAEKRAVAQEIERLRKVYDTLVLPSPEYEILTDSNLFFLRPQFNSMSRDYFSELSRLTKPTLALYGELDPIVDVQASAANLEKQLKTAGNDNYDIFIIPGVAHSFNNPATGEFTATENIILNWINEKFNIW